MLEMILIVASLIWFTLAVFVASHANGHNRSGLIWFLIVLVTGIFGMAIYLLAITSANNSNYPDRRPKNNKNDDSPTTNLQSPIDLPRRRTLVGIGGGITLLTGGVIYSATRPELRITETTRDRTEQSSRPLIGVEMANPESNPVPVEITAVISAQPNFSSDYVEIQSQSGNAVIPPNSKKKVDIKFDTSPWSFSFNNASFNRTNS